MHCPSTIKAQCYKTLVRPILEYASPVWDPHSSNNIDKLEAVQRRAARFAVRDYKRTSSTTEMMAKLQWPILQQRRQDAKLVMMYRISYDLVDIPAAQYLHPMTSMTRDHSARYMIPYCRTDIYRHSFFPSGIRLWNHLPECAVTIPTLIAFKSSCKRRNHVFNQHHDFIQF